jgi:hypothetical protein
MQGLARSVFILLAAPSAFAGTVYHVDSAAEPGGDGTTWATALDELQAALLAAGPGDEVWVVGGTYAPAPPGGSPDLSFVLPPGVAVYGGFAGDETSRDERDPLARPTTLSGDLNGDDAPGWMHRTENSRRVIRAGGGADPGVLDGLTIRGGYGASAFGSAIFVDAGAATARGCVIADSLATSGGGIGVTTGTLALVDCTIAGNRAWSGRGGGLYVAAGSTLSVSGCAFQANVASGASGVGDGGAIFLEQGTSALIERSTFVGNQSTASLPNYANGGAIATLSDDLVIDACDFWENDGLVGGALGNFGNSTIVNCRFTGNDSLAGGAVFNFFNTVHYVNCVVVANDAGDGGGFANGFGANVIIVNSILWANTSPGQPTFKAQVHDLDGGNTELYFSCVQALFETIPGEDPPDPENFPGCIDDDPLFVDLAARDLHLAAGSPCIDSGDSGAVPAGMTTDLDGAPRFIDDPDSPDTGTGPPPIVDMGAYEVQVAGVLGDADGDGDVDFADLLLVLSAWGPCPAPCASDFDGDGAVGFADLLFVLSNWT